MMAKFLWANLRAVNDIGISLKRIVKVHVENSFLLQVAVFGGDRHCVTALACSCDSKFLAAGYHNGVVRVFDVSTGECTVTFSGHRTQVSALNFDAAGMQLVSGGLVSIDLMQFFVVIKLFFAGVAFDTHGFNTHDFSSIHYQSITGYHKTLH
jgi:WD40 repeat protein